MLPYGLMIFAMGLAKKTLIADPIARFIDPIYAAGFPPPWPGRRW